MAEVGRPSEYRPEMVDAAFELASKGATSKEIADGLGISYQTLYTYMTKHPEFFDAVKRGKAVADELVEKSLYERARGYQIEEISEERSAEGELLKYRVIKKGVAPDTIAQIFWLKNRKPADWRDKRDIEHSGELAYKIIPDAVDG